MYNKVTMFFIAVLCAQFISWFLVAPDPRFVYGCLLCGAMLLTLLLLKNKKITINARVCNYLFICSIAAILAFTALKAGRNNSYRNFLLPYRLPQPPLKEIIVDNITLRIPEKILNNWNPRCYATSLPCLYIVNPRLRARGASIKNGFRLEK
jgi:hypothetical protein